MSEGMNRVMLLGNLGADPELKVTGGGQALLKMRLATTESYLDRNKQRQERTEWHQISLWGPRGEALAKFLTKGDRIFVEGRLQTSSYEKDGEKRYRTEVVATNVILNGRQGGAPATSTTSAPKTNRTAEPRRAAEPPPDDFGGFGGGDYEPPQ